jgi:acetylglutamate kinase
MVLKVGGRVGGAEGALAALPTLLGAGGGPAHEVCIVHGGGPAVSRLMERLALPVRFKEGLRVTDGAALEAATMALRGAVSAALVRDLASLGVRAVGLAGFDGAMVEATPHPDPELGAVGEVRAVRAELLRAVLALGMVPLIAPLALDEAGAMRNINADTLCGAVAGALGADLAVFLTDVPGVLDASGAVIDRLRQTEVQALIAQGQIRGGMIPKVRACLAALARGARAVCIADGGARDVLPALVAGAPGIGTIIEA